MNTNQSRHDTKLTAKLWENQKYKRTMVSFAAYQKPLNDICKSVYKIMHMSQIILKKE